MELSKILEEYCAPFRPNEPEFGDVLRRPFGWKYRVVVNATTQWLRHECVRQLGNRYACPVLQATTIGAFAATENSPIGNIDGGDPELYFLLYKKENMDEYYERWIRQDRSINRYTEFLRSGKRFVICSFRLSDRNALAKVEVLEGNPYDAYRPREWTQIAMYDRLSREAASYALARTDPSLHVWVNEFTYPSWLKMEKPSLRDKIADLTSISPEALVNSVLPLNIEDETLVFDIVPDTGVVNVSGKSKSVREQSL